MSVTRAYRGYKNLLKQNFFTTLNTLYSLPFVIFLAGKIYQVVIFYSA